MFATLGKKITANGPARSGARGADRIIAYDGLFRPLSASGRDALGILFRGVPVGVFDFRVGHAS